MTLRLPLVYNTGIRQQLQAGDEVLTAGFPAWTQNANNWLQFQAALGSLAAKLRLSSVARRQRSSVIFRQPPTSGSAASWHRMGPSTVFHPVPPES